MQVKTLKTLPRTILILALVSAAIWLLGKSALPKERMTNIVLAICSVVIPVLVVWNQNVSEKRAAETIKKTAAQIGEDLPRSDRDIVEAFRVEVDILQKEDEIRRF
jgi:hypothetical protein